MIIALRSVVSLAFVVSALALWALSANSDQGLPLEWAGPSHLEQLPGSAALQVADR